MLVRVSVKSLPHWCIFSFASEYSSTSVVVAVYVMGFFSLTFQVYILVRSKRLQIMRV